MQNKVDISFDHKVIRLTVGYKKRTFTFVM